MQLIIASPDGEVLKTDRVDWVNIIRSDGYPISIYANHAPLVTLTTACHIKYRIEGQVYQKWLSAGILSVADNVIRCWIDSDAPEAEETSSTQKHE